jgi:hypothetical protein
MESDMQIDDDYITFRQSWLDTAFRCPEEGRRNMIDGQGQCSDEAFIGTATHAGIEAMVNGASHEAGHAAVVEEYANNPEALDLKFTKRSGIPECMGYSARCLDAWVKDIMPLSPLEGAKAEVAFEQPIFEHRGFTIAVKGTADLVPAYGNEVWDWKTAASEYRQKDKQMWAIQPTIYGMAAAMGAFGRTDFTLPIEFMYGVMVKRVGPCKGQLLRVQRTQGHVSWAVTRMKNFVDLYIDFGIDKPWPMVDEKNYLCSAKWCDFYSTCRGAHVTQQDDLFGYNPR